MADSPTAPPDIGIVSVVKAMDNVRLAEKRKHKLARLQREAKAAERKAQASKRALEAEGRKKAKTSKTMRSYFTLSRNSLNRGPLECTAQEMERSGELGGGGTGASSAQLTNRELGDSHAMDTEILLSCPTVVSVSDDDEDALENDLDLSGDEMVGFDDADFVEPPCRDKSLRKSAKGAEPSTASTLKKLKKNYDLHRKFHSEWAAKESWSEAVFAEDGVMHMVQCKPCTVVRGKPTQMAPKWDTISKHSNREIHKKCMVLYASRGPTSVIEKIQGCNTVESRKKRVQFTTLFQLLTNGRPMTEYEARFELYQFLDVPEMPRKHWGIGSGWIMSEHLYDFVKQKIKSLVSSATYLALSADETSTCDNSSWIAIHAYVVIDWCRVPLLLTIQKMESDGATSNKLTTVIMAAVSSGGGIIDSEISSKLLCFGADGVNTFKGMKTGVTAQIKEKYAPFATGVHCCAHRLNLAAQSLSSFVVMHVVEEVLKMTHSYFAHSPKKAAEFRALSQQLESKGLKLLKNIKTRWMNCLSPICRLLAEYKGVIAMMHVDRNDKKWGQKARANLALLLVPYVLLGMLALLPMLEAVDTLIQWAQKEMLSSATLWGL